MKIKDSSSNTYLVGIKKINMNEVKSIISLIIP